jgi:hypothetical protein
LSLLCLLVLAPASVCLAQEQTAPAASLAPAKPEADAAAAAPAQTAAQPSGATPSAAKPSVSKPYHKPFFKRLFTVQAATATIPGAILQQVHNWPDEWGRDRLGFEKRVASLYGQFVIGCMIEDVVHAVHKEDTRYRRLGRGNFFKRTAHIVVDTVTARTPEDNRTFAYSLPANAYGSWAIATLWSPREYRNAASILEWGTAGMGVTAGTNFFREFWPDLKGFFHKSKPAQP